MFREIISINGKEFKSLLKYTQCAPDFDYKYEGWEDYIEAGLSWFSEQLFPDTSAVASRHSYNMEISALMNQYGLRYEAELITGDILKLQW